MLTRKLVRYSIARCKKPGSHPEENLKIFNMVLDILPEKYKIKDFSKTWDIMLSSNNDIVIIEPERDINFVNTTCTEAKIRKQQGLTFDSFSDRQKNIISILESKMLDGIMSWENFGIAWIVRMDPTTNGIDTFKIGTGLGQKEVTEDMIAKSAIKVDSDTLNVETKRRLSMSEEQRKPVLATSDDWTPMADDEIAEFERLLAKMKTHKKEG